LWNWRETNDKLLARATESRALVRRRCCSKSWRPHHRLYCSERGWSVDNRRVVDSITPTPNRALELRPHLTYSFYRILWPRALRQISRSCRTSPEGRKSNR
jgi:hypothetical protein